MLLPGTQSLFCLFTVADISHDRNDLFNYAIFKYRNFAGLCVHIRAANVSGLFGDKHFTCVEDLLILIANALGQKWKSFKQVLSGHDTAVTQFLHPLAGGHIIQLDCQVLIHYMNSIAQGIQCGGIAQLAGLQGLLGFFAVDIHICSAYTNDLPTGTHFWPRPHHAAQLLSIFAHQPTIFGH